MTTFPLLRKGDSGIFVKYLQYGLHIMCYEVKPFDGIFGEGTKLAVMNFQKSQNLISDGIVGDNTWRVLSCEISSIQTQLKNKGYNPGSVDGIAGENTYNAIIKFQKDNGLIDDGMVGEKTKKLLYDSGYDETKEPLLQKGSKEKAAIMTLQNLLIKKGYNCGPSGADGFFGEDTYKAVISFQKDYKLFVDGIVGIATWTALKSGDEAIPSFINEKNNDNNFKVNNENSKEECTGKASEGLIYFIKQMEGFAPSVYNDVVGVRTLGYGLTGKEIEGLNEITEEKATNLLTKYVNDNYFSPVLSILKAKGINNPLQREVDAFASFAYNLGVGSFKSSTLLKKYIQGEREGTIYNEFMRWVNAGGKPYQGLIKRRNYEWKIFSGSNDNIPGYNCKPSISIINSKGNPSGKSVSDNDGYGAKPY